MACACRVFFIGLNIIFLYDFINIEQRYRKQYDKEVEDKWKTSLEKHGNLKYYMHGAACTFHFSHNSFFVSLNDLADFPDN